LLDRLISEIANLLQISEDEVRANFTQEQLDRLLEESKCEDPGVLPSFIDSLDSPCQDSGTNFDPDEELPDFEFPEIEQPFDPTECKDAADQVNEEIKEQLEEYNDINLLLNKLIEFQDHLKILGYYYDARAYRTSEVLKDFRPLLAKRKELQAKSANYSSKIDKINDKISATYEDYLSTAITYTQYYSILDDLNDRKDNLNDLIDSTEDEIDEINNRIDQKSDSYSVLNVNYSNDITGLDPNSGLAARTEFIAAARRYITSSDINSVESKLKSYSEHIKLTRNTELSYDSILKNPRVEFKINLQGLDYIQIQKENFNDETGERTSYDARFNVATNPLLRYNGFKDNIPGYRVKHITPKEESTGSLYTIYYNKLSDPLDRMFTLEEKGLTDTITQLDPVLSDSENQTKRESGKDYYIKDLNRMNSFYDKFEQRFEKKKEQLRKQVDQFSLGSIKTALTGLAYKDVDLLLATAGFNTNLIEDNSELRTVVDSVKKANENFSRMVSSLDDEIARLELRAEELKPTSEKVKARLVELNSKCFDDKSEESNDASCADVKDKLGSDPFYLEGTDGSLPNFTQLCYWKEFAKVANIMGLAPIPNGPTQLRYWPVGLVIPTPATLVKIPLPIIWIPIICISSPLGVIVTFLTINGLFISPIIFFISSSGYKQHILTVRGPSDQFGSDKYDDVFKSTISIPVGITAKAKEEIRKAKQLAPPQADLDKIESTKQKISELEEAGKTDLARKAKEKLAELEKKKEDLGKERAEITKEFLDKKEDAKSTIRQVKSDIIKKINAIGRPQTKKIEDLKEKATKRKEKLQSDLIKALERGDTEKAKEIRELLKGDGLNQEDKINAIVEDIMEYFNDLDLPKITIPREQAKVNPMPSAGERNKADIDVKRSKFQTRTFSKKDKNVKNILKMDLAKYRKEIDASINIPGGSIDLNLEKAGEKVSDIVDKILKKVIEYSTKVENRPALGFDPLVISQLSSLKLDLDPFAPCCPKPTVEIDLGPSAAIVAIFNSVMPLVKGYIESLDPPSLTNLFGGKRTITIKDIRLSLNSVINQTIPESLEISIPEFGLPQFSQAFSLLTSAIQIPQAPFPAAVKAFTIPKQITVDFNTIIKKPLADSLEKYLVNNANSLPRDISTDFVNMSGADLKSSIIRFLDIKMTEVESLLDPIYSAITFAKSPKNVDLNVLEKTVHSLPIYGKAIEAAFTAKALLKMNIPNSMAYSEVDLDALNEAIKLLVPVLTPIVKSPIGYLLVAGAGATGNIDTIRKLHPILNFDDIPAWERLTVANVMLLLFLDEFIYEASNKVGFFRSYL